MSTRYEDWIQYWPYAIFMIVLVSWGLYHFLAPRSWRDWTGAGLVQAFIIALYAEMYGFPLTIYVLATMLGVDIPLVHYSGHLWATLLGYGRVGAGLEMAIGMVLVVGGILLIAKGWMRVHGSRGRLVTDGVYATMRHPQYTGIFIAVFGQLVHWPTLLTLALAPVIVWIYVRLARREEARMIERFGDAYRQYQRRVPMFFPRWSAFRQIFAST